MSGWLTILLIIWGSLGVGFILGTVWTGCSRGIKEGGDD
jgi:hypothetical protein